MAAARREASPPLATEPCTLERLIAPARHVEVQLLGDRARGAGLPRGAGLQRPAPAPEAGRGDPVAGRDTPELRAALFDSARRVAGTVEFHNAATVEFLLDADGNHYFLEMNTRLQVEHGVTELVTGLDLVAWQIRVAGGASLDRSVLEPAPRGHAIEVADLRGGSVRRLPRRWPARSPPGSAPDGPGVRVDHAVVEGGPLTAEYDPLLAKLMVHAHDRPAAVGRLRRALDETLVGGPADRPGLPSLAGRPARVHLAATTTPA